MLRSIACRSTRRRLLLLVQLPNRQHVRCLGISRHVDRWRDPEEPVPPEMNENFEWSPDDIDLFGGDFASGSGIGAKDNDDGYNEEEALRLEEEKKKIRDELDAKVGRGWTDPWELTDEDWMSPVKFEDLPDWTPDNISRLSQDRLKTFEGIPSLTDLASIPLPRPPPDHPGSDRARNYANFRKAKQYQHVRSIVQEAVEPKIPGIQKLPTWDEKQDAIDELFENTELELKEKEFVLGKHPEFGSWVEKALEQYLESLQKDEERPEAENDLQAVNTTDGGEEAVPVFVDFRDPDEAPDQVVPELLFPLQSHKEHGSGRMVEEWEIAAHKTVKRIMLRESTRQIAKTLEENQVSRVYVTGERGTGKTAALLTIVGAARNSGHIVLYLPDGDRLRKHGKYIEPNPQIPGFFDLPVLSQEICGQLLESHGKDLEGMVVTQQTRNKYLTPDQVRKIPENYKEDFSINGLLNLAKESTSFSSMCYSAVIETLMNQEDKPFLVVLDEFNCYYDYGHYFHMEYDEDVINAIPLNQINLFKPFLDAMGLSTSDDDEPAILPMKKGGLVVGITESRAVARKFTDSLSASAMKASTGEGPCPLKVVNVPRFSHLEVDHILSNFEMIGIGRLRFDRGETVLNENEVAYLRMVSGSTGQFLLDACII